MSIHAIEPGFLLAAPRLGDPHFEGTVVLLGVHDEDGSLGWILNGATLDDGAAIVRATGLVGAGDALPAGFDRPACRGGPVGRESVWIVYRRTAGDEPLPGSIAIGTEIGVTATVEALKKVVAGEGPAEFRLLVGYAGWSPGQLANELSLGAWLPSQADAGLLFDNARGTLWERAYAKAIGNVPAAFVSTTRGIA